MATGTFIHGCQWKKVQPLWKTVWQFLTVLNIILPRNPESGLLRFYWSRKHIQAKSKIIIYNYQELEIIKMFINKWINKVYRSIQWNIIHLFFLNVITKYVEEFKYILLSVRSQSKKLICYRIPTTWHSEKGRP